MEAKFHLSKIGKNILRVCGLVWNHDAQLGHEDLYSKEETYVKYIEDNKEFDLVYNFEDCVSLNGLFKVGSDEEETLQNYIVNTHELNQTPLLDTSDTSEFEFIGDGLYKVRHILLPKLEFIQAVFTPDIEETPAEGTDPSQEPEISTQQLDEPEEPAKTVIEYLLTTSESDNLYAYDNGKIYKVSITTNIDTYSIDYEIVDINSFLKYEETQYGKHQAVVFMEDQYTFTTYNLQECFYNINRDIFSKLCPKSCDKDKYQTLIYERDLAWMGINIIKYLLDLGQFYEASSILEQLEGCSGICNNRTKENRSRNCGCNR